MNAAAQAQAIGTVVTNLLLHAKRKRLTLTTQPIVIREGTYETVVELNACYPNGHDYQVRVAVNDGRIIRKALVSVWKPIAQEMSEWTPREIAGVTR